MWPEHTRRWWDILLIKLWCRKNSVITWLCLVSLLASSKWVLIMFTVCAIKWFKPFLTFQCGLKTLVLTVWTVVLSVLQRIRHFQTFREILCFRQSWIFVGVSGTNRAQSALIYKCLLKLSWYCCISKRNQAEWCFLTSLKNDNQLCDTSPPPYRLDLYSPPWVRCVRHEESIHQLQTLVRAQVDLAPPVKWTLLFHLPPSTALHPIPLCAVNWDYFTSCKFWADK